MLSLEQVEMSPSNVIDPELGEKFYYEGLDRERVTVASQPQNIGIKVETPAFGKKKTFSFKNTNKNTVNTSRSTSKLHGKKSPTSIVINRSNDKKFSLFANDYSPITMH